MSRQVIFETSHRIERLICEYECLSVFAKEWWMIDTLSIDRAMHVEKLMFRLKQVMTLANRVWSEIESKNLLPQSRSTADFSKIDEGAAYLIFHQNISLLGTLIVGVWLQRLRNRNSVFTRIADFFGR